MSSSTVLLSIDVSGQLERVVVDTHSSSSAPGLVRLDATVLVLSSSSGLSLSIFLLFKDVFKQTVKQDVCYKKSIHSDFNEKKTYAISIRLTSVFNRFDDVISCDSSLLHPFRFLDGPCKTREGFIMFMYMVPDT